MTQCPHEVDTADMFTTIPKYSEYNNIVKEKYKQKELTVNVNSGLNKSHINHSYNNKDLAVL